MTFFIKNLGNILFSPKNVFSTKINCFGEIEENLDMPRIPLAVPSNETEIFTTALLCQICIGIFTLHVWMCIVHIFLPKP